MQNVHFTPPQLAPLFGVNVSTIKRWSDKGYLPTVKTSGGHRRISREQLIKFIKAHPKHAKNSYVLKRLLKKEFCPAPDCWKKYYQYLLKNDNQQAGQLIEKLYLSGAPVLRILKAVFTPTMQYLSEQWASEKISVYEEHRISFNMRLHLMRLDQFIPDKTKINSPTAILACAPGEYHELPLQFCALIFKLYGWKTHVLGININIRELIKAAKKIKPKVIIISKTYSTKESSLYYNKLTRFADHHGICLAFGGGAWGRKFKNLKPRSWTTKKCVHYFSSIKKFCEFLKDYKRKK